MQWILSLVACYLILIYLHIYTASICELCCEQLNMEPIALFKSLSISAFLICSYVLLLLLLSSPRNACIFVSLDKLALDFPAKISIPDLYLTSSRKLNLQWCVACSLETRVNIWGLQLYINIFCDYCWEVKVSLNRSNSIPLLLAPLYCRFLALKNTKYVQVKFLHICCWSNLYLD